MRSKAVVGNWKLNGSLAANEALLGALLREIPGNESAACAVCVPYPYLAQARAVLEGSGVAWGSQDVSRYDKGAYTGEVSGPMLADVLTGSFVVENIFQIPGIGVFLVNGTLNRDYTMVVGLAVLYASLLLGLNLAVDLAYRLLDPRVKYE